MKKGVCYGRREIRVHLKERAAASGVRQRKRKEKAAAGDFGAGRPADYGLLQPQKGFISYYIVLGYLLKFSQKSSFLTFFLFWQYLSFLD